MHSGQRLTDPSLDEHIAYLYSLGMVVTFLGITKEFGKLMVHFMSCPYLACFSFEKKNNYYDQIETSVFGVCKNLNLGQSQTQIYIVDTFYTDEHMKIHYIRPITLLPIILMLSQTTKSF